MSVEEAMKQFPEKAGIARYGEPEEIAGLMAYLVSKEARWLTDACVRMDGGEIKRDLGCSAAAQGDKSHERSGKIRRPCAGQRHSRQIDCLDDGQSWKAHRR